MNTLHRDVNSLSSRLAAMMVNVICITYYNFLPIILGGAADTHGLSERELGFVASSFMAGLALVNIAGVLWIRRFNWKRLVVGGNLVATLAFLLPAFYFSTFNWMIFNFIAGIATGISYGVSVACLGDGREPDRNFAFAMVGQTVVCASLIFSLPRLSIGPNMFSAGQYAVALLMLLGTLLAFFIPERGTKSGNKNGSKIFPDARMSLGLKLALSVLFLNVLAEGAVWAFLERIAVIVDGSFTYVYMLSTAAWLFTVVLFLKAQAELKVHR